MHKLNATIHEDLYETLNFNVLRELLGNIFKKEFNNRTLDFVRKCYPTWKVCSWKFKSPLKYQWDDKDNRRFAICEYIKQKEGWVSRNDFYKLNVSIIETHLGKGFMDKYKGIYDLLNELMPPTDPSNRFADDCWFPWKLGEQSELTEKGRKRCRSTPKGLWKTTDNQIWYIEWLLKEKKYDFPNDLCKLDRKDFDENYGMGMLSKVYDCCVSRCLNALFPEHSDKLQWFMFKRKPSHSFKNIDVSELIKAMKYLRNKAAWSKPEDFYDLSREDFATYDLIGLIRGASFANSIVELNPDLTFDKSLFNRHKTERLVKKILDNMGIKYYDSHIIYKSTSGGIFRMDIFIQSLQLYIEIDGDQHFRGRLECFQRMGWKVNVCRDVFKMKEALKNGMSILRIVQMEAWVGKEQWFQDNVLPHIKYHDTPTVIYIETSDKYRDAYYDHKSFMENDICEDDLYV
jgi:hypothetical protein